MSGLLKRLTIIVSNLTNNNHESISFERLLDHLSNIVGNKYVSADEAVRSSYTRTPSWIRGESPLIVVRPSTVNEVSEIVKLANTYKVPIISRGGGASVAGFPLSHRVSESILIDLTRLNKIIDIDEEHFTVTSEAGVLLGDLHSVLKNKGYHTYSVDVPFYIDTLGGVLSGFNGGGEPADVATSGELYHYLLGLKVVLPTGEIIQTGAGPGTNIYSRKIIDRTPNTPDLTGLFVGDAGIFGIKLEATLTIEPWPDYYILGGFKTEDFLKSWRCSRKLASKAPYPYTRLLLLKTYNIKDWYVIYVIRAHEKEEADLKLRLLTNICKSDGLSRIDEKEAYSMALIYGTRDIGRTFAPRGMYIYFEAVFPTELIPKAMELTREFVRESLKANSLLAKVTDWVEFIAPKLRNTAILGLLLFFKKESMSSRDAENLIKVWIDYVRNSMKWGGFTEAVQGMGTFEAAAVWSENYKQLVRKIKQALDPNNIMNPGLWGLVMEH